MLTPNFWCSIYSNFAQVNQVKGGGGGHHFILIRRRTNVAGGSEELCAETRNTVQELRYASSTEGKWGRELFADLHESLN